MKEIRFTYSEKAKEEDDLSMRTGETVPTLGGFLLRYFPTIYGNG